MTNTIKTNYLALSWSTSRGRDTFGYNIVRLDDRETDQRFKCMGGGYDMIGTCVGQWLMSVYPERLLTLSDRFASWDSIGGTRPAKNEAASLYGGKVHVASEKKPAYAYLDGACGVDCMIRIAEAIGVRITSNYNRRAKRTDGYFVTDFGSAEALRAADEVAP